MARNNKRFTAEDVSSQIFDEEQGNLIEQNDNSDAEIDLDDEKDDNRACLSGDSDWECNSSSSSDDEVGVTYVEDSVVPFVNYNLETSNINSDFCTDFTLGNAESSTPFVDNSNGTSSKDNASGDDMFPLSRPSFVLGQFRTTMPAIHPASDDENDEPCKIQKCVAGSIPKFYGQKQSSSTSTTTNNSCSRRIDMSPMVIDNNPVSPISISNVTPVIRGDLPAIRRTARVL